MFSEEQNKLLREFAETLTTRDMIGVLFVTGLLATLTAVAAEALIDAAAYDDDAAGGEDELAVEGSPV